MRKIYLFFICILMLAFKPEDPDSLSKNRKFALPKGITANDYLPQTFIVKFKKASTGKAVNRMAGTITNRLALKGVNITAMQALFPLEPSVGGSAKTLGLAPETSDLSSIYLARYEGPQDVVSVINEVLNDEQVLYAEPSYIHKMSYIPNDASFGVQTYLNRLQAVQAWDVLRNAASVIIAIVDSGTDFNHEDLAANIYINQADPINGIDDDNDGYIDNYYGWDFVGVSASTMISDNDPGVKSDSTQHGVHVSGLASAVSNNGKGVASIAFNAKLMIVKAGADNNAKSIYKGYEGIKYAADHGASIINCSWGSAAGGQFGQDIIDYAVAKGCLVVAAAGNERTEEPGYPAAYKGVLSVAAVDNNDVKASFSNYGSTVDISAPGSAIYNTLNRGRYGTMSGTSMATPLVSSAAALVKAKYPQYNGIQIGELLRMTADPIDNLNGMYVNKLGRGRLNIYRALTENASAVRYEQVSISDPSNGSRLAGQEIGLKFDLKNYLSPVSGLTMQVSTTSPYVQVLDPVISIRSIATLESKAGVGPVRLKIAANTPQNHELTLKISYSGNAGTFTDTEFYNLTVALDYLNVTVNKTSTTFSSIGRVGYSMGDAKGGLGFIYRDEPLLFEASLLIGKSVTQVSNNVRNEGNYNEDFAKLLSATREQSSKAAFEASATFTDEKAASPIGLKVKSRMLAYSAAPDDRYVLMEYEIMNTGSVDLQGIYTGMFVDWDLDESSANATQYDATTKTAYAYARKNADYPYAGVRLIDHSAPAAYYPMSYQLSGDPLADGKFTTAEKYVALTSGVKSAGLGTNGNGNDIMYVIGSGPYQIASNKSVKVAYAFLAGDNLNDLLSNSNQANLKYAEIKKQTDPGIVQHNSLMQNYPNPVQGSTNIPFMLVEKAKTKLSISDITGKVLTTLVDATLDAGSYSVPVDLHTWKPGIYFYKLQAGKYTKALKMVVLK